MIVTFPFIELCVGTLFGILSAVWHPFTRSFTNKEAIHPDGFFVSPACGLTARDQQPRLLTGAEPGARGAGCSEAEARVKQGEKRTVRGFRPCFTMGRVVNLGSQKRNLFCLPRQKRFSSLKYAKEYGIMISKT
ncbi:MAG: hypothetical protein II872_03985 [Clostridia bacterium]|nr:hypothetical protein [Clostridia bacterium]